MSWIILEGLDRTGKSTVAELYKKQGYEVVHMSAPDKKYSEVGYSGPSYLDELIELYLAYDNKDVVFDRSPYGEKIWPQVYGRDARLAEDDFDVLKEFEDKNQTRRILMVDPNTQEHWQRCVDNEEPLNYNQFRVANALFNKLAHEYNFIPQQLGDFVDEQADTKGKDNSSTESAKSVEEPESKAPLPVSNADGADNPRENKAPIQEEKTGISQEQAKLEKANAINSVLSKQIIRQKGVIFEQLEKDIKSFLQTQLSELLGGESKTPKLSDEEVQILKLYCQRIKDKARG